MAYTVHNFEQGDVLYAEQLNEMDAQIAANEENIENGVSSDMLAEDYSANKTYSIGDYVIHNNELYTCIYEITASEGWNPEHWEIANLGNGISGLNRQLSDVDNALSETAQQIDNLFNPNDTIDGKYLSPGNVENTYSSAMITNYFPCKKGETFTTLYYSSLGVSYLFMYDSEYNYLGASTGVRDGDYVRYTSGTANAITYGRINNALSRKDTLMVINGNTYPPKFIPYETHILKENIPLSDKQKSEINPLFGKKMSVVGDSICYGAGYSGGYAIIITDENSMSYQNIAVSGATITANTYSGDTPRTWICRIIQNMSDDADYAIVEGGVNDASLNVPLGTINQYYNATFDDTTFIGALESIFKQITEKFDGKKVGFIIPHGMTSEMLFGGTYNTAIRECCKKWGIPLLDLSLEIPPFAWFPGSGDTKLAQIRATYTNNGDGWHPSESGYRKYYVPKIEAWLKTL